MGCRPRLILRKTWSVPFFTMAESAALLVDEVFPARPFRQWVLTVPFPLRFLFAAYPELMGRPQGIYPADYRTTAGTYIRQF